MANIGEWLPGGFRLEASLGAGGFGEVFRAHQTELDRPVAIKVLHAHLARKPGLVDRFLREARTTAKLRHPNLVELYSVGRHEDGTPFLVMELLQGESLEGYLEGQGPLAPTDAVDLCLPALRGLGAAHAAGFVHRDFKPANVFLPVDHRGRPLGAKVLDFGVAKAVEGTLHNTDGIIGTPEILAPEQFQEQDPTPRVDVYAAGILLYRLVSGRFPYQPTTLPSLMHSILTGRRPALAAVAPAAPPGLVALVESTLSIDPTARPADADALLTLLERWRRGAEAERATRPHDRPSASRPGTTQPDLRLPVPLHERVYDLILRKEHAHALELLPELARLDPENPDHALNHALCLFHQGRYLEARDVQLLGPPAQWDRPGANHNLACIEVALGRGESALRYALRAVKVAPDYAETLLADEDLVPIHYALRRALGR